ncbi:integrin beta-1-like isoform X1 [Patiria miniata]|uniref:Integrin beta n=1 Tax=Patiria miniata TaxID=46514 RepID=A0A913Z6B8_PATMI|nr:integrin beta-1-like isoform X1 [Patiria miniata]
MEIWRSCLVCVIWCLATCWAQDPLAPAAITDSMCTTAKSCDECIVKSPQCGWCESKGFDDDSYSRCDLPENLRRRGCKEDGLNFPKNKLIEVEAKPLSDAGDAGEIVQVNPQKLFLQMRPGEPTRVQLNIRQAEDFPVDLYYVMDLSQSMANDLDSLKGLGDKLAKVMKNITKDFRLGYGAFVDKVKMPYVDILERKLQNPCLHGAVCVPPFGFRNVLPLTSETNRFSEEIGKVDASGNLDNPEGGLDALMQATVCKEEIGWRDRARHLLLYSTDAPFHIAGDGKLAGIVKLNDGKCHMDAVSMEYSASSEQDYPSISQLSGKMQENSIFPIFAIGRVPPGSADPMAFYRDLPKFFHESEVNRLTEDSSNVVELVEDVYRNITSGVKVEDDAPADLFGVEYTATCVDGIPHKGMQECSGLQLGDNVTFSLDITMTNKTCDMPMKNFTFSVGPTAFKESLQITIQAICDCACSEERLEGPDICNGNGTQVCGGCQCFPQRSGAKCTCDKEEAEGIDPACVWQNSTVECSDRGNCECGKCLCNTRTNPVEEIYGDQCQCDTYSCELYKKLPCGGPTRGDCKCNNVTGLNYCQCKDGWSGSNCGCEENSKKCISPDGLVCSNVGVCECGKCSCNDTKKYRGATCQNCDSCPSECDLHKPCVQCKVYKTGKYKDNPEACNSCPHEVEVFEELPNRESTDRISCVFKDENNCNFEFTYRKLGEGNIELQAVEEPSCPLVADVLWIIIGIIIGIILVGIALLLIWRLLTYIHDRREFQQFEKERTNAQWEAGENPIYKPSTSVFKNPTYGK